VKSIKLIATAATHAARIGEASAPSLASYATRFIVREKLDSGAVLWKFRRRSFEASE
jgi:hypothetical protein